MESYAALVNDSTSRGEEVWNQARLKAYIDAGYAPPGVSVNACSFCAGMQDALTCEDGAGNEQADVYTYPADPEHPAPWYDPADPDSGDFAGVMILGIEGWETAGIERPLLPRLGNGAVLGRPRYLPREMRVDALLLGRTCCSLTSGLRWLTAVLGAPCSPCEGQQLDYFECCPGEGTGRVCTTLGAPASDPEDLALSFDRHRRTLRQVGLTDGVRVTEKIGRGCGACASGCSYMRVEFTLTAGDPFSYGDLVCYSEDEALSEGEFTRCVQFSKDCDELCGGSPCPAGDPNCPAATPPPRLPAITTCGCQPLVARGTCTTIESLDVPDFQELVPVITIKTLDTPLRHVEVVVYENPLGLPPGDLSDCNACAVFTIGYIQPESEFVIDGRDRRFWMRCPGRPQSNAARLVSGADGQPFTWPVLSCGGGYSVCVLADQSAGTVGATVSVCMAPRSAA